MQASQTEYETTRRTTVKRRETKPTPAKPARPTFEPIQFERVGKPGSPKGMIEFIRGDAETGWCIVDGCVPDAIARLIRAAYEVYAL